jgi:hypothetical protein
MEDNITQNLEEIAEVEFHKRILLAINELHISLLLKMIEIRNDTSEEAVAVKADLEECSTLYPKLECMRDILRFINFEIFTVEKLLWLYARIGLEETRQSIYSQWESKYKDLYQEFSIKLKFEGIQ